MGRQLNPTTIGAFVVGAIVLMLVGALLFGGNTFWHRLTPQLLELTVFGVMFLAPSVRVPTSHRWGG